MLTMKWLGLDVWVTYSRMAYFEGRLSTLRVEGLSYVVC